MERDDYEAEEPFERDSEPLARIVARRAVRSMRRDATTPEFGYLLAIQAFGAAGDALLALALAGTLFFAVPTAEARGRVALYLALTVAPFAIVSPVLARVLDRSRGSLRWALLFASLGRGLSAWLLATRLTTLYLYPLAFAILILSRAQLIIRGAMLPDLVPPGETLVKANSALSRIAALSGMLVMIPGVALLRWAGVTSELLFAAAVYAIAVWPVLSLPRVRGRIDEASRIGAQQKARDVVVRQAILAAGGMRFLVGFLVFHLAFVLKREDFGAIGLGVLVGSAAFGGLVGALVAPRLRRTLREEGILVLTLVVGGLAGLAVGWWFSPATAGVLVFVFGIASGASKVAFDAIVQRRTPEGGRGWAFARFESFLQLAWVAGGIIPLILTIPGPAGLLATGVVANVLALLFVAARSRSPVPPRP